MHTAIQKDLLELEKLGHNNPMEARELVADISVDLAKIIKILSSTSNKSTLMYEYRDEHEMTHGQRLLIDVAFKTLAYIRQRVHPEVEQLSW